VRLLAVVFDARDPAALAQFWADLLGRSNEDRLVPGDETQIGLRFLGSAQPDNRMHLHITSSDAAQQQEHVERALSLGGGHLDIGQSPDEGHIVLGDPEGNPFCVIDPGNRYLEGTGLLGELACAGPREVGVFWSELLGWPLVWDQDEETAIQSPAGGTKLAWGGQPAEPTCSDVPRFELIGEPAGLGIDPAGMPYEVRCPTGEAGTRV
jgi:catechol 2,3-dioxygenase-like lactoylglutathione lyase family enzyme